MKNKKAKKTTLAAAGRSVLLMLRCRRSRRPRSHSNASDFFVAFSMIQIVFIRLPISAIDILVHLNGNYIRNRSFNAWRGISSAFVSTFHCRQMSHAWIAFSAQSFFNWKFNWLNEAGRNWCHSRMSNANRTFHFQKHKIRAANKIISKRNEDQTNSCHVEHLLHKRFNSECARLANRTAGRW